MQVRNRPWWHYVLAFVAVSVVIGLVTRFGPVSVDTYDGPVTQVSHSGEVPFLAPPPRAGTAGTTLGG